MKIRTKIISSLDVFESDLSELDDHEIFQLKNLYSNTYKLDSLSLKKGNQIIYFPRSVIANAIIILEIQE